MNEKIKELAELAGYELVPFYKSEEDFRVKHYADDKLEKFAEAIIKECANVADKNQAEDMNWPIGNILKEHFGIKE